MSQLEISKTVKDPLPTSGKGLKHIKEKILGKNYELSVVFIGDKLSRRLNNDYRKKDYPTNVLSFPLSSTSGEIFINVPMARRESSSINASLAKHTSYLFIHGCLHLKGFKHGARMDSTEEKLRKKFGC